MKFICRIIGHEGPISGVCSRCGRNRADRTLCARFVQRIPRGWPIGQRNRGQVAP